MHIKALRRSRLEPGEGLGAAYLWSLNRAADYVQRMSLRVREMLQQSGAGTMMTLAPFEAAFG